MVSFLFSVETLGYLATALLGPEPNLTTPRTLVLEHSIPLVESELKKGAEYPACWRPQLAVGLCKMQIRVWVRGA